jgi:UDP-glucuronate 4-epimerase
MSNASILVTGCAGFIGFHTAKKLLSEGKKVVGIDNLNPYYDVTLKKKRLAQLQAFDQFSFGKIDFSDHASMHAFWQKHQDEGAPILQVIHLGAQAGVRYSLKDPFAYIESNIQGFMVILELCRYQNGFKHLVYASTSSVYGANDKQPFQEEDFAELPMSLYAATKRANEHMAQSYYHLYSMPCTGLRFFTVYGPWGRPDMAAFLFGHGIMKREPIDVFNFGKMTRDFTYIDDIVQGILGALDHSKSLGVKKEGHKDALLRHRVYNLSNNKTETLMDFIQCIEEALGQSAIKNLMPLQPGDVPETFADITRAQKELGYQPSTSMKEGIHHLMSWFKEYYYPDDSFLCATRGER